MLMWNLNIIINNRLFRHVIIMSPGQCTMNNFLQCNLSFSKMEENFFFIIIIIIIIIIIKILSITNYLLAIQKNLQYLINSLRYLRY